MHNRSLNRIQIVPCAPYRMYMRIVFLGTPEFAVASLKALIHANFHVVAVVTAPDKPAGRGMKIQQSLVKQCALKHQLPVLQPEKLKDPEFIETLRSFHADIQVVVAFRMLPEVVWNMPPLGTINVHASLLPDYRGAAPINHVIINGETITGVTTFRLRHEIDTGPILLQEKVDIGPDMNAGELHNRLMDSGAGLIVRTLKGLADGSLKEQEQDTSRELHSAPKLHTESCRIQWDQTASQVRNKIRGLSPYPGAFTIRNEKKIKIFQALVSGDSAQNIPGTWTSDQKTYIRVQCATGSIDILELQVEGKTRMPVADFLRGNTI